VAFRSRLQQFNHTSSPSACSPQVTMSSRNRSIKALAKVKKSTSVTPEPLPSNKASATKPQDGPQISSSAQSLVRHSGEEVTKTTIPKKSTSLIKRESLQGDDDYGAPTPAKKRRRTKKEKSANDEYYPENNLVDSLRPGLILVMIGLNPGLKTAQTGKSATSGRGSGKD
jgi:hypothetical protein